MHLELLSNSHKLRVLYNVVTINTHQVWAMPSKQELQSDSLLNITMTKHTTQVWIFEFTYTE